MIFNNLDIICQILDFFDFKEIIKYLYVNKCFYYTVIHSNEYCNFKKFYIETERNINKFFPIDHSAKKRKLDNNQLVLYKSIEVPVDVKIIIKLLFQYKKSDILLTVNELKNQILQSNKNISKRVPFIRKYHGMGHYEVISFINTPKYMNILNKFDCSMLGGSDGHAEDYNYKEFANKKIDNLELSPFNTVFNNLYKDFLFLLED
jgi:hypothetical protein